jgi:hypothetical protein
MGRRGDKKDVPVRIAGEIPQQFVALVFGPRRGAARARRCMRLVHD